MIALVLWSLPDLSGQPRNPFAEEEAPPAVFSLDRTDAQVDLYLLGSWRISSVVATGLAFHPPRGEEGSRVTFPYLYPRFETRLFEQELDLTLSLWLYSRYFFEATFADDFDNNSIAAGYVAGADELIREVVVGNVPLTVDQYPYMYTGSEGARTGATPLPGALLRMATERTSHELLVQLESSRPEQRRFAGSGEILQLRLRPEDYLKGQAFILPHAPVDDVRVYVEDRQGEVEVETAVGRRRFRVLDEARGEWVLNRERGEIRLTDAVPSAPAVVVSYRPVGADSAGQIVALDSEDTPTDQTLPFSLEPDQIDGDATLGRLEIPLNRYRIEVLNGPAAPRRRGILLREPGLFSPFEDTRFYSVPVEARGALRSGDARVRLVRRDTRIPHPLEDNWQILPAASETLLRVNRIDPGSTVGAERDRQYPFWDTASAGGLEILIEYLSGAPRLILDGSIVPGTVQVTRDGRPLPGVSIDYGTGEVQFASELPEDAEVDISYRVYNPGASAGDVVAVLGNRWEPRDDLHLTLAGGLRWTTGEATYSQVMDEHPGQVTISLGMNYQSADLTVSAAAAGQLNQPDTSGFFRLFGGEEQRFRFLPGATTVFPAPAPLDEASGDPDPGFRREDRADALYRNYWSRDLAGNTVLGNYRSEAQADSTENSGSRIGPYVARSTDEGYTGPVSVLEWEVLEQGKWLGALIRVPREAQDLRDAREITVTYRYEAGPPPPGEAGPTDPPELRLDMGTTAEDLDGDGTVDRGRSPVDPTLEFVYPPGHPREGQIRRAGPDVPGLSEPHREDMQVPGTLLPEAPEGVLRLDAPFALDNGGWRRETVTLDAADASRLASVRGVRVLLRQPAGAALPAGRLLIGTVEVTRSSSTRVVSGHGRGASASITDDPVSPPLRDTSEVVRRRFNPGQELQPVLRLSWQDSTEDILTDLSDVAVETGIAEFSPRRYGTLVFFVALPPQPGADIQVTLAPYRNAPESASLGVTIPVEALTNGSPDPYWQEVRVDLRDGMVTLPNSTWTGHLPRATLPRNGAALLRTASIRVGNFAPAGTLLFDELYATDPAAGGSFAGDAQIDWTTDLGSGRLNLSQQIAFQGVDFRSGNSGATGDSVRSGGVVTTSRGAYSQGPFRAAGEVVGRAQDDTRSFAFGHELVLPLTRGNSITLFEEFYRDFDSASPFWTRNISLSAGTPEIGRYRLDHFNRAGTTLSEQRWSLNVSPPAAGPFRFGWKTRMELRDLDQVVQDGSFGSDWVLSTSRFIPIDAASSGSRQERSLNSTASLSFGPLQVDPGISWVNRGQPAGTQISGATVSASLPLDLTPAAGRPVRFTPSYRRAYRVEDPAEAAGFAGDARTFSQALARDPLILRTLPVVELFQDSLPAAGITENREYRAEGRLRLTRPFASRLRDLWVPHDVELLLGRDVTWEGDSIAENRQWRATIGATAFNLFGSDSNNPRFLWYQGDEFRQRLAVQLHESGRGNTPSWGITARQETRLVGPQEKETTLRGVVDLQGPDTITVDAGLTAGYRWRRDRFPPVAVLLRRDDPPFYRHEESLEWRLGFDDGSLKTSTFEVTHETTLVIQPNGEIRWHIGVGWIIQPDQDQGGALHILGLRSGLEGVLRY